MWIIFRFNPFSANSAPRDSALISALTDSGINLFFCNEVTQKRELNQKPSDSIVQDVDLHFFFPQTQYAQGNYIWLKCKISVYEEIYAWF